MTYDAVLKLARKHTEETGHIWYVWKYSDISGIGVGYVARDASDTDIPWSWRLETYVLPPVEHN